MSAFLRAYQKHLDNAEIEPDSSQEYAVKALQTVFERLCAISQSPIQKLFRKMKQQFDFDTPPVPGLYLWGGVGRGKTFLMDLFFDALPFEQKQRLHFHHFMMLVHEGLKKHQGKNDPLRIVAKHFAKSNLVLCFDEFFVSDIADAMLMANLFKYFFTQGVTLVATSNIHPNDLYHNGLQRSKFLPTIRLIKKHCEILNLDNGFDYRLRYLEEVEIFHYPLDNTAKSNLQHYFKHLAGHNIKQNEKIEILGRQISTIQTANEVIWFSFSEICQSPRSQYDYIEIAKLYRTIIVSDVMQMNDDMNDVARRFIMMIDEFYDHHVTLIMSLDCAVAELYQGNRLQFEFKRTLSRLQEMKSKEYLALQHIV